MVSLHVMTQNRATDLLRLIDTCKPYVDNIRVCDGGSSDNTKDICRAYGVEYYYKKWSENFSMQDNFLLSKAQNNEWILQQDDDETPSLALLENLKGLMMNRYNKIRVPCLLCMDGNFEESVSDFILHTREGKERFYRDWLFKNIDGATMSGLTHRGLLNNNWTQADTEYPFIHIKTSDGCIINECSHALIYPYGHSYSDIEGTELLYHCKENGIKQNKGVKPALMGCGLTKEFMAWIIAHANEGQRSISKWFWAFFYIYHPSLLSKYVSKKTWLEQPSLSEFLRFKRGYTNGTLTQMSINPLLLEMLNNAGIHHCTDLEIY